MTCGIRVMCGLLIAICVPIRYGEYLLIINRVKYYFYELHISYDCTFKCLFDFIFAGGITLSVQVLYWRLEQTLTVSTNMDKLHYLSPVTVNVYSSF